MPTVDVYHWNPRKRRFQGRVTQHIPLERQVNNFGDLLGPIVVEGMRRRLGLEHAEAVERSQLMTVGSVIHLAEPNAVVWGSGVNGKRLVEDLYSSPLDVRAVRGPRTREYLERLGHSVPEVYGDPALLLGELYPELRSIEKTRDVTVVSNLNDRQLPWRRGRLNPRRPVWQCLRTIAASRLVVGSSLHGIVVAEALGIPARLVRSRAEPDFKYDDYYAGTGRPNYRAAESVAQAVRLGGEAPHLWDPAPLLAAFPGDLWVQTRGGSEHG